MWGRAFIDNCIDNELSELVDNYIVKHRIFENKVDVKSNMLKASKD